MLIVLLPNPLFPGTSAHERQQIVVILISGMQEIPNRDLYGNTFRKILNRFRRNTLAFYNDKVVFQGVRIKV